MTSGHFDEADLNSFYYKNITLEDARAILLDQEQGVFLIRDSSRGGYVICLKEQNEVMQYPVHTKQMKQGNNNQTWLYVREECPFKDLPALLSFYKRNLFKHTGLIRPVDRERVLFYLNRQDSGNCASERRITMVPGDLVHRNEGMKNKDGSSSQSDSSNKLIRMSAPPDMNRQLSNQNQLMARVIKPRHTTPYDSLSLALKVGEIVKIESRKNGQGYGELVSTGKKGNFPLTHIELIDSNDLLLESQES